MKEGKDINVAPVTTQEEGNVQMPKDLKFFVVLFRISAFFLVITGLILLISPTLILSKFAGGLFLEILDSIKSWIIILGFVFILNGILNFFIARGIVSRKNWARILIVVFSGIGIVTSIYIMLTRGFMDGIFNLAISLTFGWYFLLDKKIKKYFLKN